MPLLDLYLYYADGVIKKTMTSTCFHGNAIISYHCLNHTVLKKTAILKDIAISIPTSEITHVEQLFHLSVNMYTVLQLPDTGC